MPPALSRTRSRRMTISKERQIRAFTGCAPEGNGSQLGGIYRCEPAVIRYRWDADETIGVLQGRVRIEFENGESPEFRVGDVASVTVGDRAVWHIPEPFCELFVLTL